ncbi:toxin-antitoxin system YwqK family antitoxin [Maribacter aestuarii]|uniref:toxin-antitoxin system YwqK family antitoxin n=1 Tax=Maribacter aestuarii TaxID=1130723 RepID=UPI00248AF1A8|nr:hypothetical protein [Maribacter aestuarii]
MKKIVFLVCLAHFAGYAQNDNITLPPESEMVSMNDASVKYGTHYGQQYFENASNEPYTGWLFARYDNGELESVQQFKDGIGNGIWINYNPDGSKESQGTYVNNKTEGPAKLFYEDGSVKGEGKYVHLKNKVGWWTFYDRKGNVVSKRFFTR